MMQRHIRLLDGKRAAGKASGFSRSGVEPLGVIGAGFERGTWPARSAGRKQS
jgi:hypothetical protein